MTPQERSKMTKAKLRAKKAAEERAAKKKVRGATGEYGFGVNTINHKFCLSISKKAKTMKEICSEEWNPKERTHYGFFNKLKSQKLANRTKDAKMFMLGSKADPKNKK